eukprot:UN01017
MRDCPSALAMKNLLDKCRTADPNTQWNEILPHSMKTDFDSESSEEEEDSFNDFNYEGNQNERAVRKLFSNQFKK